MAVRVIERIADPVRNFLQSSQSSGIVLGAVTLVALLLANLGLGETLHHFWMTHLELSFGQGSFSMSLEHWVNDGLMAIFFLFVGLEIKRELLDGELSSIQRATLPAMAALGGMAVPALTYIGVQYAMGDTTYLKGWGIPMATDIAFALGFLGLLGDRAPRSLKIFLAALAIVDDMGAVLVIALFYTTNIQVAGLIGAGVVIAVMGMFNLLRIRNLVWYLLPGIVLWYFMHASGVHATVAGVMLAFSIPYRLEMSTNNVLQRMGETRDRLDRWVRDRNLYPSFLIEEVQDFTRSISPPSLRLEMNLHFPVMFLIMPLFAFTNTGIVVNDNMLAEFNSPISWGIMLGLVVGKPLGIFLFSYLAVRFGLASLPRGARMVHIVGLGLLGGIGFTMSIFIATLGFRSDPNAQLIIDTAKLAILISSAVAAFLGYLVLYASNKQTNR